MWSASLAFAPVRRTTKPKPAPAKLPPGAAIVASLAAAGQPVPIVTPTSQTSPEEEQMGWAKKMKAPSMVIDDDVNGFRAARPEGGGGKKKKKVLHSLFLL